MYAIERIRIIKRTLEDRGQAQVSALSGLLGVSEVTIRRDLERLENEGWLTRTHGGAVINQPEKEIDPLQEALEEPEDHGQSDEIAGVAVRMIRDGDVVMLTNGTVSSRLAGRLEGRRDLTVLTNDLSAALRISLQDSNRVVLLGGDLNKNEKAVTGSMALANLNRFYVNRLFIEVDGVNDRLQLTVNGQDKADLILGAMEVADESIILCPSDRFGHNAFYRLGNLSMVKGIVTDNKVEDGYKSRIFSAGIPLYTSMAVFEGTS